MLEIKDLVFTIDEVNENSDEPDSKTIIDKLSFNFESGKFYGITGPNGGGKTTLAKLIMGIHPATEGKIFFNNQDLTELSITERSRVGIGFSFQHPARFKGMTFRDLLSIASGSDDEEKHVQLLTRVGICSLDFLDKEVGSRLSGGEIKKVELATTIATNPKLAIYDEPDTGIDLWTVGPMVDLLKKEQKEKNVTTIVISHNEKFLEVADEVLIVRGGKVFKSGSFDEIKEEMKNLDFCSWKNICEGVYDVRCHR